MTTALREDELLRRGAAADPAEGHLCGLRRVQPPRRRLRHRHGGRDLSAEGRHDERHAHRRRRRRGRAAPHRRGRADADRPAAEPRHLPGRGARGRARRSIRSTTPASAPTTAAASCAPWSAARWSSASAMNDATGATKWIGQSVERLEDPPLVTGRGRFAGDINFPRQLHMRIVRSNHAHANIVSIDTEAARGAARRGRGVDRGRHRRRAADRFPRRADREARAVPPAGAGDRTRCAMSASRSPRCSPKTLTSPRTPPISSPWRSRNCRCCSTPRDEPGEFSFGRDTEADDPDARATATSRRCSSPRAHIVELKLTSGRHSGVPLEMPRRARPLRRLARHAGAARRRQGAAPEQGADRAHAQPRRRRRCSASSRTSAAASASAARSIPRTFWSASPRCGSSGR